jgi:hypothetical protein
MQISLRHPVQSYVFFALVIGENFSTVKRMSSNTLAVMNIYAHRCQKFGKKYVQLVGNDKGPTHSTDPRIPRITAVHGFPHAADPRSARIPACRGFPHAPNKYKRRGQQASMPAAFDLLRCRPTPNLQVCFTRCMCVCRQKARGCCVFTRPLLSWLPVCVPHNKSPSRPRTFMWS